MVERRVDDEKGRDEKKRRRRATMMRGERGKLAGTYVPRSLAGEGGIVRGRETAVDRRGTTSEREPGGEE